MSLYPWLRLERTHLVLNMPLWRGWQRGFRQQWNVVTLTLIKLLWLPSTIRSPTWECWWHDSPTCTTEEWYVVVETERNLLDNACYFVYTHTFYHNSNTAIGVLALCPLVDISASFGISSCTLPTLLVLVGVSSWDINSILQWDL